MSKWESKEWLSSNNDYSNEWHVAMIKIINKMTSSSLHSNCDMPFMEKIATLSRRLRSTTILNV